MILYAMFAFLLVAVGCGHAQTYDFRIIDVPFAGAHDTGITGLSPDGDILGGYSDREGNLHGFLLRESLHLFQTLLNVSPLGMGKDGAVIGRMLRGVPGDQVRGFYLLDGTFRLLAMPPPMVPVPGGGGITLPGAPPTLTEALAINQSGIIVGHYRAGRGEGGDGLFHGFAYNVSTQKFTTLDFPGAITTTLTGINDQGRIVGFAIHPDETVHALSGDSTALTEIALPGGVHGQFAGIAEDILVGKLTDTDQAFVLRQGVLTLVAVPSATQTRLAGVRKDGVLYGSFVGSDGARHGFVATPRP